MKLYEIGNEAAMIIDLLDNEHTQWEQVGQEVKDEVIARLAELKGTFESKAESICKVIREYELRADGLKEEKNRLDDLAKQSKKRAESLKSYLSYCMKSIGKEKVETDLFTMKFGAKRPSIIIEDETIVSDAFVTEKVVRSIDKKAIKDSLDLKKGGEDYLKSDVQIDGISVQWSSNLQIK